MQPIKHELRATTQNTTHVDRRAYGWANLRPHAPKRDRTWSTSVRTPTRNHNSRQECRDPNTTLQHETRHADKRAHTKPRTHIKTGYVGSVRALSQNPWMTPDRSDRTLSLFVFFFSWLLCTVFVWKGVESENVKKKKIHFVLYGGKYKHMGLEWQNVIFYFWMKHPFNKVQEQSRTTNKGPLLHFSFMERLMWCEILLHVNNKPQQAGFLTIIIYTRHLRLKFYRGRV